MTAVAEPTKTETGVGRVVRVIGPVVDAEFPRDQMPDIYSALHVDVTLSEGTRTLTLEVAQHLGDNLVRAISMQPTDGLIRGAEVTDTGSPIWSRRPRCWRPASRCSTCWRRTCAVARSAFSVVRAWARRCSSRR